MHCIACRVGVSAVFVRMRKGFSLEPGNLNAAASAMANFCGGDFYSNSASASGSNNASGFSQRRSRGAGGRLGVSQWGREQLDCGTSTAGGGGDWSSGGAAVGRGGFPSATGGGTPNRMAIQNLSPHLANTVS
jgi:hypothetical protein